MSFDYTMVADGTQAVAESRKVERSLTEVEAAAKRVGDSARDAFGKFSGSKLQSEMLGAAKGADALAKSFGGVATAMRAEADMLARIKGPLREYSGQLNTLDALLERGKITTAEYATQVARLNRELERNQQLPAPKAPGSGGKPAPFEKESMGSKITGAASGAAMGLVAAFGIHEAAHLSDSYTEVSNRLKVVAHDTHHFNTIMAGTFAISQQTRGSMEAISAQYARLTAVTHEMGVTTNDTMRMTTSLAMGVKISGSSAQEAAMAMGEFMHAFEIGALTGREFKVLMKDTPMLMAELQKASGKSGHEFAEMGKHGKITADLLMTWFARADGSIREKFGRTVPTISEQFGMFKDRLAQVFGTLNESLGIVDKVASKLSSLGNILGSVGSLVGKVSSVMGAAKSELGIVGEAITLITDPAAAASKAIDLLGAGYNALTNAFNGNSAARERARQVATQMLEVEKKLVVEAERNEKISKLQATMKAAGVRIPVGAEFNEESANALARTRAINAEFLGVFSENPFEKAVGGAAQMQKKLEQMKEDRAAKLLAEDLEQVFKATEKINDEWDDIFKKWEKESHRLKDLEDAMMRFVAIHEKTRKVISVPVPGMGSVGILDGGMEVPRDIKILGHEIKKQYDTIEYGPQIAKLRADTVELKFNIDELNEAYKKGTIDAKQYAAGVKALGIEKSALQKLLDEIKKPQKDFNEGLKNATILFDKGAITAIEYANALDRLRESHKGVSNFDDILNTARGKYDNLRPSRPMRDRGAGTEFAGMLEGEEPAYESHGEYVVRMERLEKAEEEVLKIEKDLQKARADAGPDLEKVVAAQEKINAKARESAHLTAKWHHELNLLREDAGERFVRGFREGLQSIKDELFNVAAATKDLLAGSFNQVNDAIAKSVIAGGNWRDNFKAAGSAIEEMLVRISLKILEMAALQAIMGLFHGGGGGGGAGVGIWPQDLIGLFANGGEHDSGGVFRVGGSGGPDSQNVMMRLTPGEIVSITPRADVGRGGGGGTMHVVNHFDGREISEGMSGPQGARVFHNFIRRNPGAVRSNLRR